MNSQDCPKCGRKPTNSDKWRWTLYTTVLFLIVVNPLTYKLVNSLLGMIVKIADSKGCPSIFGILIHATVFTVLLRKLMDMDI
jgi:hypothetical protein